MGYLGNSPVAGLTLPNQANNAGKFLATNGSQTSWTAVVSTLPFYKADSTSDTLPVVNGQLSFYKADGTLDTIGVS